MITYFDVLPSLAPNAEYILEVNGSDYTLTWLSTDITQPTDAEIQAELTRLQAEYDAAQYQRNRSSAYPSIQEQLDMQYWDSVNGTTTWADAIAQVKADYPKGTE
jgi:hypothetical protein